MAIHWSYKDGLVVTKLVACLTVASELPLL